MTDRLFDSDLSTINVSCNGQCPRASDPDLLWELLMWLLLALADQASEVRYVSIGTTCKIQYEVKGVWYGWIPPSWRAVHLLPRLVRLLARNSLDRIRLEWQRWRYTRTGNRLRLTRPITITVGQHRATGMCQVFAVRGKMSVRFLLSSESTALASLAKSLLEPFHDRIPWPKLHGLEGQ